MTLRDPHVSSSGRRSRFWPVIGLMCVIALVALTLAAHGVSTYHSAPGKPTVMPLGDLLGFGIAGLLLILVALVVLARVRGRRS